MARRRNPDRSLLAVPTIADELKPPVQSVVSLESTDSDPETWTSRLIRRDGSYDYLDALKDARGQVLQGWTLQGSPMVLHWGKDRFLWKYTVRVVLVMDPLPSMQVVYLAPPIRTNRRSEWRSEDTGYHMRGRVNVCGDAGPVAPSAWTSVSRDFSFSAVRFFSPVVLVPGCHVQTEWQWDQAGVFRGSLMIVRRDPGRVQYREAEGVNLVGVWDPPLTSELAGTWQAFCLRHRHR